MTNSHGTTSVEPIDPLAKLEKPIQSAVRIAVAKARWTHVAADQHFGDVRIHAYPLPRSGNDISWGVISNGECIASGVDTLKGKPA